MFDPLNGPAAESDLDYAPASMPGEVKRTPVAPNMRAVRRHVVPRGGPAAANPVVYLAFAGLLALGCDHRGGFARGDGRSLPVAARVSPDPFIPVLPDDPRFAQNPSLLQRLVETPHGYFRFVNRAYTRAVCARFARWARAMPQVNLHGDAHLEQYTATDVGAGLADFDDSAIGPAVVDLVRFGGSLRLAAHTRGWEGAFEPAWGAFLQGYRRALEDPLVARPATRFTVETRRNFRTDRSEFVSWATGMMAPGSTTAEFDQGYQRYQTLMAEEHPELPPTFFSVVRAGRFRLGVGSALDEKYLVRVQGFSAAAEDDVILEYKEVRALDGIDCVRGLGEGGALRILLSQARIGQMPYEFLAQVPPPRGAPPSARTYWVHEWRANYEELSLGALTSPDDLLEIARDVGLQLGKGHPRAIAAPFDSQLRRAQRASLDDIEGEALAAVVHLTDMTVAAWRRFRDLQRQREPDGTARVRRDPHEDSAP